MKECKQCGKSVSDPRQCVKYCCVECQKLHKRIDRERRQQVFGICKFCQKECMLPTKFSVFCSFECSNKWKAITYKGRKLTTEWKERMDRSKIREIVRKEGEYTCEKCDKTFCSNTSLRSHRSYCTNSDSEKCNVVCDVCGKILKRQRNLVIHKKSHDPLWVEKTGHAVQKGIANRKPMKRNSLAEIKFFEDLKSVYGVENVEHKFRIIGVSHEYDFCLTKLRLIVEFDGDYWHGNPKKYELTCRMKKQYRIDQCWEREALKAGYKFKRVWQSESEEFLRETNESNSIENQVNQEESSKAESI